MPKNLLSTKYIRDFIFAINRNKLVSEEYIIVHFQRFKYAIVYNTITNTNGYLAYNLMMHSVELYIIQWLYENKIPNIDWSIAMVGAGVDGSIEIIEWLIENEICEYTHEVAENAAEHDQLHVLEWLHTNGYYFDPTTIGYIAVDNYRDEIDEWINATFPENIGPAIIYEQY